MFSTCKVGAVSHPTSKAIALCNNNVINNRISHRLPIILTQGSIAWNQRVNPKIIIIIIQGKRKSISTPCGQRTTNCQATHGCGSGGKVIYGKETVLS